MIHKKGDVENVSNYSRICLLSALHKLFSAILYGRLYQCLTRNEQKIKLASENPTRQQTTLQHTDWLNRNATSGESKCGQRQLISRRRSIQSLTNQFGVPSNLATSITTTLASWRRYTRTKQTDEMSNIFDIQKGTKQGDPLYSFLFNTVFQHSLKDDIQRWQKKKKNGYILERPRSWLPHEP